MFVVSTAMCVFVVCYSKCLPKLIFNSFGSFLLFISMIDRPSGVNIWATLFTHTGTNLNLRPITNDNGNVVKL